MLVLNIVRSKTRVWPDATRLSKQKKSSANWKHWHLEPVNISKSLPSQQKLPDQDVKRDVSCWIWDVILFFGQSPSTVWDPQKSMNHHKGAYVEVVHSNIQLDVHICRCRGWGKRTVYSLHRYTLCCVYIYIYILYTVNKQQLQAKNSCKTVRPSWWTQMFEACSPS